MPEILISVTNKIPQLVGDVRQITSGNRDYRLRLIFDDDWEDGEKTVLFVRENGFVYPPVRTENDECVIPEVNGVPIREWLYIGVKQGEVHTSRPCGVTVYRSIADMIDDEAVQPDPSMWEDVLSRLEKLEKSGGGTGGGGSSGGDAMRLLARVELPYEGTPPIIDMIDFTRRYTFADIAEAFVAGRTITLNTEYDVVPFQYGMFQINTIGSHGIEFHGHYWRVKDVEAGVDEGWVPAVAFLREDGTLTVEDRQWSGYARQAEVDSLSKAKADKAGWTPDKYIGTDAKGNLVEKDAPTGGDVWMIDGLTAETVIADDDALPFHDASAKGQRKTFWSNIKAALKTYFDGVYLKRSGDSMQGTLNLNGNLVMPFGEKSGIRDNTDNPVMRYETINNEASLRLGHKGARLHVLSSARPMYNGLEFAVKNDIPDTYNKAQIDAIMGSYVNDIDALIGGDA